MPISLYIHIPFCSYKCPYCHFYVIQDKEELKDLLLHALLQELASWKPALQGRKLVSIYFGGGTPILFGAKRTAQVLDEIQKIVSIDDACEISIEANPENSTPETMHDLIHIGINRVSIGIQSFHQAELDILGRKHSVTTAEKAISTCFDAGFTNISIDLMYEVPNQTQSSWHQTLKHVEALPITHLSLYNLTIEPYTAYARKESALRKLMPDEEAGTRMYRDAISSLESIGLQQYEISAFAKYGLISRHNVGYWIGREFLGLGPSAFSFYENKRFQNCANLPRYCKLLQAGESPIDFTDNVTKEARKKELLALHLRLIDGVDLSQLQGALERETEQTIAKLKELGLLTQNGTNLRLTEKGILFYDTVASELI